MPTTGHEVLRRDMIEACDAILDAPPIVRRFVSEKHKRLTRALRSLIQRDDGTVLGRLATLVDLEPIRADDDAGLPDWTPLRVTYRVQRARVAEPNEADWQPVTAETDLSEALHYAAVYRRQTDLPVRVLRVTEEVMT
jgi:hypothetical protein